MAYLKLNKIEKSFGDFRVIKGIDLAINHLIYGRAVASFCKLQFQRFENQDPFRFCGRRKTLALHTIDAVFE